MLVVLCLAVSVVEVDATIVNVALPSLAQALNTTSTELMWVVDAFMLTFAANSAELIFWRALLGLGAAGILPASLALITVSFPPSERGRALGIWTAMTGLALPLGPIIGGWLLDYFWWGSIFLVNVPITVVVLVGNFCIIVEPGGCAERGQWDIFGLVLSTSGVTTLLGGLIEGPQFGWSTPGILGVFIAGIAMLAGFLARQRRAASLILDLRLLRLRSFTTGTTVNLLILSGVLFVLTQYLQSARGYSPLQAGLAMAPLAAAVTVASVLSGAVVAWIGARATVTTGLLLIASGTLALAVAGLDTGYLHLGLGLAAIGFGTGLGTAPAITITLSEVPSGLAGISSAVANSARQFGGALGVAVLGSISFLNLTVRSFVEAMHVTATIAAVTCILGAGVALALLPHSVHTEDPIDASGGTLLG